MCYKEYMAVVEPKAVKPTRKRRFRLLDAAIAFAILAIIALLLHALLSQLSIKHEVSAATAVTDAMITDIQKQHATAAYALGDTLFQKQNSVKSLTAQFAEVASFAHGSATREHTTVTNDKSGQAVSVIYKYSQKPTLYIRVIAAKPAGATSWHVVNLNGNTKETPLLNNKY